MTGTCEFFLKSVFIVLISFLVSFEVKYANAIFMNKCIKDDTKSYFKSRKKTRLKENASTIFLTPTPRLLLFSGLGKANLLTMENTQQQQAELFHKRFPVRCQWPA